MTMPYERYRSLKWSIELMQELHSKKTSVPEKYRDQINAIMAHLPTLEELDAIADADEAYAESSDEIFPMAYLSRVQP